jgi:transcriptional regulator with XRE-family HTH domain
MDYLDQLIEESKKEPEFARAWAALQIVDKLARRREAMGLSQEEVAQRMNVARARVSEIEHRPERVAFSRILAYANAVGAELEVIGPKIKPTARNRPGRPVVASASKKG